MPFVIFNCADYADNPSLLVSILFGARKGAYTGADSDQQGLIEKANGGMLFLDEIHRLPPEGQEMLFSFLDRGKFRRLGDSETERTSEVGLIAATTESPESALLKTFVRRIPMIIKLPSLVERSMDERLEIIREFYENEATRLGMPINASINSIRALLGYACPNNVGQLKTDIQLLCARAYSDYIAQKKQTVQIVTANLPPHIKEGLFTETTHRDIWNKLTDVDSRFCTFYPNQQNDTTIFGIKDRLNIYELIVLRMRELQASGAQEAEIEQNLDEYIQSYFSRFCSYQNETTSFDTVIAMTEPDVAQAIMEIIRFAEQRLARSFPSPTKTGIAMHVMNAIKRIKSGKYIKGKEFNRIRRDHPKEFTAAVECLTIIDRTCEISMPLEEASFLTFFFLLDEKWKTGNESKLVSVVVMTHGESTASSMAKTCNSLLGVHVAEGIDVPLNEPLTTAWSKLRASIVAKEQRPDVLLLVDMGSLTNLGQMLETELSIRCKTISLVSTLHVIQAVRRVTEGFSLDQVYEDVREIRDFFTTEPTSCPAKQERKKYIVTLCATGEGTALMIKNRLAAALSYDRNKIQIVNLGVARTDDIRVHLDRLGENGQIIFIVSPFRLETEIPQYSIDDVMDSRVDKMQSLINRALLLDKISDAYADYFTMIDSPNAFSTADAMINRIETTYGKSLLDSVKTGILCHIACMLDRLKSGGMAPPFEGMTDFIGTHKALFNIVGAEVAALETKFAISIPDEEICHIVSFFHPDNCEN